MSSEACDSRMESADNELLQLLAAELRLDGGCSELSLLPTYNPRIRRLLGERKLSSVVREHSRYKPALHSPSNAPHICSAFCATCLTARSVAHTIE